MTSKVALVLEDEVLIAIDIESTLVDAGYEVVAFTTFSEALIWLGQNLPTVAILDLNVRDGPCNLVALLLTERHIPFVVHSGSFASAATHPDFAAGIWLNKPSSAGDMLASISKAISSA